MNNEIIKISLKNDKRIIPELSYFVSQSAEKLGLSKTKAYYLCFALETALEARTNFINDNNPEVTVQVIDNGSYFKITLTDFGEPYILTKNQKAILKRKLVDKYYFEQLGRKGQKISFVYYYDSNKVENKIDKQETTLLDEEYSFRQINNNDEDILKAINCLYETYNYEYYHQNLYSVDSFKKYIKSGRYVPVIGENKHCQTICYCALDENTWFEGVPELSNLVTAPFARGKSLASQIFKETQDIAKQLNYEGVHVSAVAYHPYTQKMCNKFNYTPSALEYSINPAGTGGYDSSRRLDCVIGVKIFNKQRKHDLYIKEECNDLFNHIFKNENLNYEIHNETYANNNKTSLFTYELDTDTENCFIKIDECGKNIKDELNDFINNNDLNEIDVITVNLNMNHINSIDGYDALKKLGFICTGCIPGSINGDYMLLQWFRVKPEYDKIVLEDNYKVLVDYIKKLNNI